MTSVVYLEVILCQHFLYMWGRGRTSDLSPGGRGSFWKLKWKETCIYNNGEEIVRDTFTSVIFFCKTIFYYSIIWIDSESETTVFTLSIGTPYHTCPKIWNSPFYSLLMCLKYCCMYGKQCRPRSDAASCGIWSGSTLFAKAYLSQYFGLLQ